MKNTALFSGLFFGLLLLLSPRPADAREVHDGSWHGKIKVVSTTGIINDMVVNIGGDKVAAKSLMGPGVDPHLYKATAGDIRIFAQSNVIFYHGLHLEGKISDVLENMKSRGVHTVAVAGGIPKSMLIATGSSESYDPHVWFDPKLWSFAARSVAQTLSELDPANAPFYGKNLRAYLSALGKLDTYAKEMSSRVAEDRKILVTSHDAFGYFGRAYGFKVVALQGLSTVSEASISDVRHAVRVIMENRLPAVFTESSVSPRYIEAVKEAVESSGMSLRIGGKLYSDALGNKNSPQGTFRGMFRHNVEAICFSLSEASEREIAAIREETENAERFR